MKIYKVWLTCLIDINDDTTTEDFKKYMQESLDKTRVIKKILKNYKVTDLYCEDVYDIVEKAKARKNLIKIIDKNV